MNWLMHNAIADMYGPYFLLVYGGVIVAIVVVCYQSVRSLDRTADLDAPRVTGKLDPYEIAYLRGGENEVTRVAIASLIQRGLLRITEKTRWLATTKEISRGRRPVSDELSTIEALVLKWPGYPATAHKVAQPSGIPSLLKGTCIRYESRLTKKNLLAPPETKPLGARLCLGGSAFILGLGGYKFAVALEKGHHNVALLIVFGIVGTLLLAVACLGHSRASQLGKAYLDELKLAYKGLKSYVHPIGALNSSLTMAADPGSRARLQEPSAYADCLLMVAIFGMASLVDTPLSDLATMFKQGGSSTGGCGGGGCGGGGCGGGGCGGGCGGCGG